MLRCVGALMLSVLIALAGDCGPAVAQDAQVHRIGVLAHRPKPAILAAYAPTADHLSRSLPGHRFDILPLDLEEMDRAIAARSVDFILTNPEQYIVFEMRHHVTRIATIVQRSNGRALREFGGVILVKAGREDLRSLDDLRGRRIAGVDAKAFGGYLMQAGELLDAGLDLRQEAQLEFLGLPQDRIVQAVAEGRVDAGFVRTGVIEAMVRDGKVRAGELRALNSRSEPGFPFLLSTRLYPEWPFASTTHVSEDLAKQVLIALLALPADSEPARQGGYHSWAIPLSYEPVHQLMKALRVAPYDRVEQFSLRDVLRRYESEAFALLTAALVAMFLTTWRFQWLNRRLGSQVALVKQRSDELEREISVRERAERRLAAENDVLDMLAQAAPLSVLLERLIAMQSADRPDGPVAIFCRDPQGPGLRLAAAARFDQDLVGIIEQPPFDPRSGATAPANRVAALAARKGLHAEAMGGSLGQALGYFITSPAQTADQRDFIHHLASLAALAIEQAEAADRLRLNASVFGNALEGIVVTDPQGTILDVNTAFTTLTGYERHEAIGNNPRMLKSGLHDAAWYRDMWQTLLEQGQWQGELWNRHKGGQLVAEILHIAGVRDAAGHITHYVGSFSDITGLKETQARLERAATFDSLTGLPNRSLLTDRLRQAQSQARRRGTRLAICFVDLDDFKPVNDTLGHAGGDALLREVARRLEDSLRAGDTVARLGGDEFVLLLSDIGDRDEISQTLERLLGRLAEPYTLGGQEIRISASVGVTVYPQDDVDPDALLRHADQAMYRAKQGGRNRFHLFDTDEDEQMQLAVIQQQRLRHALRDGELRLHYQPKINLRSGRLLGVEALLRWAHPERGLLSPALFLPAIEHHELICQVGEWVLEEALRQRRIWSDAGLQVDISVNIAAHHFLKPDFVPRLAALLATHAELPRDALELEIVETAAVVDMVAMVEVVKGCRTLGVRIALDDFGTGYSSLSYLKLLPADTLKIDRSFVLEMLLDRQSLAIVEGIVSLASTFQRQLVAEGVETTAHGTTLLRLGCEIAQGYGIGRPMPGEALPAWAAGYQLPEDWRFWSAAPWDLRDFPLLVAEVDHRHWVESIIAATTTDAPAPEGLDMAALDQCGFGAWLERHGRARYGRQADYPAVSAQHRDVHQIAYRIVDLIETGRTREAHQQIRSLREGSERLLVLLARLQRQATPPPA